MSLNLAASITKCLWFFSWEDTKHKYWMKTLDFKWFHKFVHIFTSLKVESRREKKDVSKFDLNSDTFYNAPTNR